MEELLESGEPMWHQVDVLEEHPPTAPARVANRALRVGAPDWAAHRQHDAVLIRLGRESVDVRAWVMPR